MSTCWRCWQHLDPRLTPMSTSATVITGQLIQTQSTADVEPHSRQSQIINDNLQPSLHDTVSISDPGN